MRCPLCGVLMKPVLNHQGTDLTGEAHPRGNCFFEGHFIGAKLLPGLVPKGLAMTVEDGHPAFNDKGEGKAVTPALLNEIIKYYREVLQSSTPPPK